MEVIESNLLSVNCYCEYDGWEIHKENWLTPVGDIIAFAFPYKQQWFKLLAFHSLTVVPVYFLSTESSRRGGWYFPYLFCLFFKWLTHICSNRGVLVFAFHAQRSGMGAELDERRGSVPQSVMNTKQRQETIPGSHAAVWSPATQASSG